MTGERPFKVLFLCTGNSARSIMAEAYLNSLGGDRFHAYSAGSHPSGKVHPFALEVLGGYGITTEGLSSKGWDEFAKPGAPQMDIIVTVCDQAAGETCPVWPGQPVTAHWGVEDPASATGDDETKRAMFKRVFLVFQKRIRLLANLKTEALDHLATARKLEQIGNER